jgi:hypothetical protein
MGARLAGLDQYAFGVRDIPRQYGLTEAQEDLAMRVVSNTSPVSNMKANEILASQPNPVAGQGIERDSEFEKFSQAQESRRQQAGQSWREPKKHFARALSLPDWSLRYRESYNKAASTDQNNPYRWGSRLHPVLARLARLVLSPFDK